MATLILGAVGSALGGPIGGALGALLGNRLDNAVLGKRREGPRLTELAVQTSSYGTPIPLIFGTMRVAGTVIWSTDLKESRERSGGGKGQASTTSYSYSASFAVLLSGRPIVRVARIWADGRLLRGSAGDLKVKAALRVHTGGEDQAADPLIAGAEGGAAPAYRGMAYAVFEDLPLGEFGNRIPSLSFEVVADAGAVAVDTVTRAMGARGGTAMVDGFAATGTARGVLEVLEQVAGGWWAPAGAGLALVAADAPPATVVDLGAGAAGLGGAARGRSIGGTERAAQAVAVSHYDPARDYQAGLQRVGLPGGRVERVEMPAVLAAGAAKTLAAGLLARIAADRVRRTVTLGLAGLAVAPGAVVRIAGETGTWRVVETALEAMAVRLTLAPVAAATLPAPAAASGRVLGAPDEPVGRTLLRLAETPALDDTLPANPRVTVVAAGEGAGWRRAALLWSSDDGASWMAADGTAAPGIIGTVEKAPAAAPATLLDLAGALVVRLARGDMVMGDADAASLDRGANLAMAGGELIQFGRAEALGEGRWRLSGLLRGRRGTEAAAVTAGDGFALIEAAAARVIELPLAALGREIRVMASGVGDAQPAEARLVLGGLAVRPPAPVQLAIDTAAGGGALLRWTRRSRAGWRWSDGVDAPLGEESERYRVTLIGADAPREIETGAPQLAIAAAERAGLVQAIVRQRGTWAESLPATISL